MTMMNAFLGVPLGIFDCTPDFFVPDFGRPEPNVIDIPSSEVTDLSDEVTNPFNCIPT